MSASIASITSIAVKRNETGSGSVAAFFHPFFFESSILLINLVFVIFEYVLMCVYLTFFNIVKKKKLSPMCVFYTCTTKNFGQFFFVVPTVYGIGKRQKTRKLGTL